MASFWELQSLIWASFFGVYLKFAWLKKSKRRISRIFSRKNLTMRRHFRTFLMPWRHAKWFTESFLDQKNNKNDFLFVCLSSKFSTWPMTPLKKFSIWAFSQKVSKNFPYGYFAIFYACAAFTHTLLIRCHDKTNIFSDFLISHNVRKSHFSQKQNRILINKAYLNGTKGTEKQRILKKARNHWALKLPYFDCKHYFCVFCQVQMLHSNLLVYVNDEHCVSMWNGTESETCSLVWCILCFLIIKYVPTITDLCHFECNLWFCAAIRMWNFQFKGIFMWRLFWFCRFFRT